MLDGRGKSLLKAVNEMCGGGYKVVSFAELAERLPQYYGMNEEDVKFGLSVLSAHDYVSVKYQDDSDVCLCPLPKGKRLFEEEEDEKAREYENRRSDFIACFWGAFAGGSAAGILAFLVFFLWRLLC